jgi:hypothetical protein
LLLLPGPVDADSDVDAKDEEEDDAEGELGWTFVFVALLIEGLTLGVDLLVARGFSGGFDEERPLGTLGALVLSFTTLLVVLVRRFICCEM